MNSTPKLVDTYVTTYKGSVDEFIENYPRRTELVFMASHDRATRELEYPHIHCLRLRVEVEGWIEWMNAVNRVINRDPTENGRAIGTMLFCLSGTRFVVDSTKNKVFAEFEYSAGVNPNAILIHAFNFFCQGDVQ